MTFQSSTMNMKLQILALIGLVVQLKSTSAVLTCNDSHGIYYTDCGPPTGQGASNGTHEGPIVNTITSCQDVTYTGGSVQRYKFKDLEEFKLVITSMSIPLDETLIIETFQCVDGCKLSVINSSMTLPFEITMNKQTFVFWSKTSSASVIFKIDHECGGGPHPCDAKGFTLVSGTKWMKLDDTIMLRQYCNAICVAIGGQMLTLKSKAISDATREYLPRYNEWWLGLERIGRDLYQWDDGDQFTVNLATGRIPEYNSWYPWSTTTYSLSYISIWEGLHSKLDEKNCFTTTGYIWIEVQCSEYGKCACECEE